MRRVAPVFRYKEGAKLPGKAFVVRPALAQSNRNCHLDPPRPHSSLTAVRRSQHNSQSSRTARPDAVLLAGDRIRLGELDLTDMVVPRRIQMGMDPQVLRRVTDAIVLHVPGKDQHVSHVQL